MFKGELTMSNIGSDYISMKLAEAKQEELRREAEKDHLAEIALKEVKNFVIRLPKIKFGQN
jgi:hypothetical protein